MNALRDIVYIVCATCVAGINVRCMPVEAVDCMSKFRSTEEVVSAVFFYFRHQNRSVFGKDGVEELRRVTLTF